LIASWGPLFFSVMDFFSQMLVEHELLKSSRR